GHWIARPRVHCELARVGQPPAAGPLRRCPLRPRRGVMAGGAGPGTGAPAGTGPKAAQRQDTAVGRAPAAAGGAARVTSRLARVSPWVLAAGVAAVAAVRAPGAAGDVRAILGHLPRLPLRPPGPAPTPP